MTALPRWFATSATSVGAFLARRRVFLSHTNHLSDRELYSVLWHTVLREEVTILPEGDTGAWHVSVPGDGPESTSYLTYYGTEEDRESWQKEWPEISSSTRGGPMPSTTNK